MEGQSTQGGQDGGNASHSGGNRPSRSKERKDPKSFEKAEDKNRTGSKSNEQKAKEKGPAQANLGRGRSSSSRGRPNTFGSQSFYEQRPTQPRKCNRCMSTSHLERDCKSEVKCYACMKFGHIRRDCPLAPERQLPHKGKNHVASEEKKKSYHFKPVDYKPKTVEKPKTEVLEKVQAAKIRIEMALKLKEIESEKRRLAEEEEKIRKFEQNFEQEKKALRHAIAQKANELNDLTERVKKCQMELNNLRVRYNDFMAPDEVCPYNYGLPACNLKCDDRKPEEFKNFDSSNRKTEEYYPEDAVKSAAKPKEKKVTVYVPLCNVEPQFDTGGGTNVQMAGSSSMQVDRIDGDDEPKKLLQPTSVLSSTEDWGAEAAANPQPNFSYDGYQSVLSGTVDDAIRNGVELIRAGIAKAQKRMLLDEGVEIDLSLDSVVAEFDQQRMLKATEGIRTKTRSMDVLAEILLTAEDLELPPSHVLHTARRIFDRLVFETKESAEKKRERAKAHRRRRAELRRNEVAARMRSEKDEGIDDDDVLNIDNNEDFTEE